MSDLTYQLTDIFLDKDIDESFKCGICMDILKSPIFCGGGHSWCLDCIKSSYGTKCPICPEVVNITKPVPNFTVKSLIDKMICRCPHNYDVLNTNGETEQLVNTSSNKKRKIGSSNESISENIIIHNDDSCIWTGRYDQLENHLKNCVASPFPCAFTTHGCDFIGTKKLLEDHYMYNNHIHNLMISNKLSMISNKLSTMENANKLDKVIISQLNQKLVQADSEIKKLREASSITDNCTIKWSIKNVDQKLRQKIFIYSDSFDVIAPNGNKYKMHLRVKFGDVDGKDLALSFHHKESPGYSNEMSIDISGTVLTLHHEDPNKNIDIKFSNGDKIPGRNQGLGCIMCKDIITNGFIKNDQIIITAKVKVNNSEKLFTSA